MALRINTNVAALSAHKNMIRNDNALSSSLEKLSSGLRINRAADDASGMAIADSLKSQALALGQAIRNANDGISMVQTADGALDESIKIVNTIKSKAIQAAQDGQTTDSRKAIQADIDKLMAELDIIAKTTSFNGQKLLSGAFTNKKFQIGAFSGETVGISIGSSEAAKTGHLTTATMNASGTGEVRLSITSSLQDLEIDIQSTVLAYDNTSAHGMGALADAINKVSNESGVTAQVDVSVTTTGALKAGSTGSDFAVNGVNIGALSVLVNDGDGSLVNAINMKSDQHGVTAAVDAAGVMSMTSIDGRAIQVSGNTGTTMTGSDMSTLGSIKLFQIGANQISISDESQNVSLDITANLVLNGAMITSSDSVLAKLTDIKAASTLKTGSTAGFVITDTNVTTNITTTEDSIIKAGSTIGSGSVIETGSVLGGTVGNSGNITTTEDSVLTTGSHIGSGTVLETGTVITTQFVSGGNTYTAGTALASDVTVSDAFVLTDQMLMKAGTIIHDDSTMAAGSYVGADLTVSGTNTVNTGMTLEAGSIIFAGTGLSLAAGSTIGGDVVMAVAADDTILATTLKAGSTLATASELAKGSTVGGDAKTTANLTLSGDMTLAAGSQLTSGSTLKSGTVLSTDVWVAGGNVLSAGTTLQGDAVTSGVQYLNNSLTLKTGSILFADSVVAGSQTAASGASATTALSEIQKFTMADISVTSQEGAQVAISIADSALKNLDKIRSDLGSVQNQLTSTIANLSVTRVNVFAAESSIRDVDFAEEAANFSRMQILNQAGSFAMAQANASSQNVLSLLQG